MDDELLTVAEVAEKLRVGKMTVYRLVEHDELAHIRVGRSIRILGSSFTRYLLQGGNSPDFLEGSRHSRAKRP